MAAKLAVALGFLAVVAAADFAPGLADAACDVQKIFEFFSCLLERDTV